MKNNKMKKMRRQVINIKRLKAKKTKLKKQEELKVIKYF